MDPTPESSIATSLRLMKALSLARHGKMRAAQALLGNESALPEKPVELHALAALVTSEGDYSRALRLWRLLLQREPGHREARRMIASIELWLSRPPWVRYVPAGAAAVAVLVVAIVLMAALGGSPPRAGGNASAPSLSAGQASPARALSPSQTSAPPPPITIPGMSRRRQGP
jgi:negative regulator of sigma E activity